MDSIDQRLDASYASLSAQILQSRRETHDEIIAMRAEVAGEFAAVRAEFSAEMSSFRADLEAKIDASADETRRFMKILYEDILSRIALLGEGRLPS